MSQASTGRADLSDARSPESLFEAHHAGLRRYLRRFTGDEALAEDAAQEAFVRLLDQPEIPPAPGPWLYRVATNYVRDETRTRTRRLRLVRDGKAMSAHGDPAEAPERSAARLLAARRLRDALAALSEKERQALLMREEGFKQREIAAALGTTTGSIGTLLRRAIEKAADALGPPPEFGR